MALGGTRPLPSPPFSICGCGGDHESEGGFEGALQALQASETWKDIRFAKRRVPSFLPFAYFRLMAFGRDTSSPRLT